MVATLLGRDANFRWYWLSRTVSLGGSQVTAFALPLVAAVSLGSGPAGVSAVAAATFLPNLIFPLLAGHLLERIRKRPVMIWSDVLRALLLMVVPVAWWTGTLSLPLVIAVTFASGTITVFSDISGFALIPTLVSEKDLQAANQAVQGSATVSQIAGPGTAGVLVQTLGAPAALLCDATCYLASAFWLNRTRGGDDHVTAQRGRVRDGILLLLRNVHLRALTTHAALYNATAQILTINLLIWAIQQRDLSAGAYGVALSCAGVGALAGTLLATGVLRWLSFGGTFATALCFSTGAPLAIPLIPGSGPPFAIALGAIQLVSGLGLGCANVLSTTLRQIVVPKDQVARTNGGYRFLMFGSIPIGSAAGGILGSTFTPHLGVTVGTIGLAISALPMLTPRVRRLAKPQDATDPTASSTSKTAHDASR
ncbi:MFS transporter [Phytohabitans aurantiacus]|uniref:MFS transporter n=1 Tax=Phytohabitans aurantiacus TaxID=3016789 RepID=A0ABQ5QYW2_9ACTN|nr:MFS transporter [Phytohabitans aurantiacus]GLH99349.1 MFS transporter [Phytohabitans aurantiacus]